MRSSEARLNPINLTEALVDVEMLYRQVKLDDAFVTEFDGIAVKEKEPRREFLLVQEEPD